MAVHPDFPDMEVTVHVNGRPSMEYDATYSPDDPNEEDKNVIAHMEKATTTKWIEAATGQEFAVHLQVTKNFPIDCDNLSFETFVDGQSIERQFVNRKDHLDPKSSSGWDHVVDAVTETQGSRRMMLKLVFSEINTTDEVIRKAIIQEQKKQVEDMGTISIEVRRCGKLKRVKNPFQKPKLDNLKEGQVISHKAVLEDDGSKSHGAKLGARRNVQKKDHQHVWTAEFLDGIDYPLAIFIFKYRSKATLESIQVIPQSPCSDIEWISPPPKATRAPSIKTDPSSSSTNPPIKPEAVSIAGLSDYVCEQNRRSASPEAEIEVEKIVEQMTPKQMQEAALKWLEKERLESKKRKTAIKPEPVDETEEESSGRQRKKSKLKEIIIIDLTDDDPISLDD